MRPGPTSRSEANGVADADADEEFVGEAPTHEQTDPQEGGDSRRRRGRRGRRGGGRRSGGENGKPMAGNDRGWR